VTVGPRGTATKSSPGGAGSKGGSDVPTSEVDVLAVPDRKNNQTGGENQLMFNLWLFSVHYSLILVKSVVHVKAENSFFC